MVGLVTLYTISGCPHCIEAKHTLNDKNLDFEEVLVDKSSKAREWLKAKTGKTSVPQIFFNDTHIGGNEDLQSAVKNGEKWNDLLGILQNKQESNLFVPTEFDYESSNETEFTCAPDPLAGLVEELVDAGIPRSLRPCLVSREHDHAFSGKDFIEWFSKAKGKSEEEGVEEGNNLLKMKFILPLNDKTPPKMENNSKIYYRLNKPDADDVLNSGSPKNCQVSDPNKLAETLRELMLKMYTDFVTSDGKAVDYEGMKASDTFKEYQDLARLLQRAPVEGLTETERKAFFINIYNALVIHATAVQGPPKGVFARGAFYRRTKYVIGGSVYSLDDIEHGVLRGNKKGVIAIFPQFKGSDPRRALSLSKLDPRLHFALNCGAKSCPPIKTYRAQSLDEELKLATESYLESDVGILIVEGEGKTSIKLSSLFRWYSSDFGDSMKDLLEWVATQLEDSEKRKKLREALEDPAGYKVSFLPYDWQTNAKN